MWMLYDVGRRIASQQPATGRGPVDCEAILDSSTHPLTVSRAVVIERPLPFRLVDDMAIDGFENRSRRQGKGM